MHRRDLLKLTASAFVLPALSQGQTSTAFFSAHQYETLTDFCDVVIPATDTPGAKDAQVPRYLDKLLAASDRAFQDEFAGDLETLDSFSRQTAGTDFVRLAPDQRNAVLEKMFLSPQRPSFDRLKAWTARIYYATKPGFDELNKGGRVPASFACTV